MPSDMNDDELVRTSPCGRWEKRRKSFSLREFPCMPGAYLAMDTEEGKEVVWIELKISTSSLEDIDRIKTIIDTVIHFSHPNLVAFHDYWIEELDNDQLIIFITESLTCGSINQFIKKSKLNQKTISFPTWRRWCCQILLGMQYLHSKIPPFILSNLDCDNIFIQHNGLVKIALIHALSTMDHKVHLKAETASSGLGKFISPSIHNDIICFGHIALELASLEPCSSVDRVTSFDNSTNNEKTDTKDIQSGDRNKQILKRVKRANPKQANFIRICLKSNETNYPSIRGLLLHPVLFEVPKLMQISGKMCVDLNFLQEAEIDFEMSTTDVIATVSNIRETEPNKLNVQHYRRSDFPADSIDKYLKEISIGMHPIIGTQFPGLAYLSSLDKYNSTTESINDEEFKDPRSIFEITSDSCSNETNESDSHIKLQSPQITRKIVEIQEDVKNKQEYNFAYKSIPKLCVIQANTDIKTFDKCFINYRQNKYYDHKLYVKIYLSNFTVMTLSCYVNCNYNNSKELALELYDNAIIPKKDINFITKLLHLTMKYRYPINCTRRNNSEFPSIFNKKPQTHETK